ncbi:MAG: TetR/AcrR family transcriptional regulator [Hyphomicrobiales bacterium]|nr:MAG: TetR/AcrR family transcriptional regulator [Hyphomicrobiales bacterium]
MIMLFSQRGGDFRRVGNMGRRSTHTPQQLRDLILDAAQSIIEAQGLAGLSAREIARRIEYSPGTIYNMFQNLDDVVLHVEGRVLDGLDQRLSEVLTSAGDKPPAQRVAQAYLAFSTQTPRLWNLLFEHHLPQSTQLPAWYQQKLETLTGRMEQAIAPEFTDGTAETRRDSARALWAAVHGITSLATADKLTSVTSQDAVRMIDDLVTTYLAGLAAPKH